MCLLGVLIVNKSHLGVQSPPKTLFWGPDFKPNMRKIQIAISSDLCIRLTWNLTGSRDQQQTSWVVSYGGKIIPRWRTAAIFKNRYIAISQRKIIRFWWNFVHSSRFWTGWTSRDQKWKSCIGQTRQNVFLVLLKHLVKMRAVVYVCLWLWTERSRT